MTNVFSGKSALLASSDRASASLLTDALRALKIEVAGYSSSLPETHDFLIRRECDFVFASIFLPMLPASGIEEGIYSLPLYKKPAVLYFAGENTSSLMLSAFSPVVTLPVKAEDLKAKLLAVYPVRVRDKDVQKAEEILSGMGFSPVPARKYLSYACALSANDINAARNLKRTIYPAAANAFGIKDMQIADAMRRLIDKTFLSGDIENQYKLFGSSIDETRGKPTVSQLLALVGEMIRMDKNK